MKILHIWDQAGTASVIAKEQRKLGHNAKVIQQAKHDKNGICRFYKDDIYHGNKIFFVLYCLMQCKNYEIIQLHDAWFMVHLVKLFYPRKKIIMHYHGSMVRYLKPYWKRKTWEFFCDKIIVATPDLLSHRYYKKPTYLPNPVDTELFTRLNPTEFYNTAFSSLKKDQSEKDLDKMLKDHGIDLNLVPQKRDERNIEYWNFGKHLEKFEYYIDIPEFRGQIIPSHSICGLQAMSLGCKVVGHDFKISDKLPEEHNPKNVNKKLMEIYNAII